MGSTVTTSAAAVWSTTGAGTVLPGGDGWSGRTVAAGISNSGEVAANDADTLDALLWTPGATSPTILNDSVISAVNGAGDSAGGSALGATYWNAAGVPTALPSAPVGDVDASQPNAINDLGVIGGYPAVATRRNGQTTDRSSGIARTGTVTFSPSTPAALLSDMTETTPFTGLRPGSRRCSTAWAPLVGQRLSP